MTAAEVLLPLALGLGEGAVALNDSEFLFVDIRSGAIWSGDVGGGSRLLHEVSGTVGAVAPATDGEIVFAGTVAVGVAASHERIGLPHQARDIRLNDGKADPVGRFVAGTMADPPRPGAGTLWSFDRGRATPLIEDVTISNGLCWSDDGSTMFYIDTPMHRVDAFDYDVETGFVSNRRVIVEIPADAGSPDGMTIDRDGGLWVALWGGSGVHRYVDGRLDDRVDVGTPFVTSATFVGERLVITTAAEPTDNDSTAGHVFVADVDLGGPLPHAVGRRRVSGD